MHHPTDSVLEYPCGIISIFHSTVPDGSGRRLASVHVCTATDAEVADRELNGEESGDVVDEHTSCFWFTDQHSFRAAFGYARQIARTGMIEERCGIVAGGVWDLRDLSVRSWSIIAEVSAHHVIASGEQLHKVHHSDQAIQEQLLQLRATSDPWAGMMAFLQERSALNQSKGGNEMAFITAIALWVLTLSYPLGAGDRK